MAVFSFKANQTSHHISYIWTPLHQFTKHVSNSYVPLKSNSIKRGTLSRWFMGCIYEKLFSENVSVFQAEHKPINSKIANTLTWMSSSLAVRWHSTSWKQMTTTEMIQLYYNYTLKEEIKCYSNVNIKKIK